MTRIALITPPSQFLLDERVFVSLGILKIAAVLEDAGYVVDHLDLSGVENYEDVVRAYSGASLFGITATTAQIPAAIRVAALLRLKPASKIILGGPHGTLTHAAAKKGNQRAMESQAALLTHFDAIVCGDGESAIFSAIAGTGIIDADDPKSPLWLTSPGFNDSPWPARHLVDIDSYHYTVDGRQALSLIGQLGCLAPDTPVAMASGEEAAISSLAAGDMVLCFDQSSRTIVAAPVAATYKREANDIWEVKWDSGRTLRITGEHPIYTEDGWKTIAEIAPGTVSAYMHPVPEGVHRRASFATRKVLHEAVPVGVAKDARQHQVAEGWSAGSESEVRRHGRGGAISLLHRGAEQFPGADTSHSGEDCRFKARGSQSHEASRGSSEGFENHLVQVGRYLFAEAQEDLGRGQAEESFEQAPESFAESRGTSVAGNTAGLHAGVLLRGKWERLDWSMPVWKASQSGLHLPAETESDSHARGILAYSGVGSHRESGLSPAGMASACGVVGRIESGTSVRPYSEDHLLWSRIISKRFIGRGTVCNITVHPGHSYFANQMLVHNCPYRCSFCGGRNSPSLRNIRLRSSDNVVAEMVHLHRTYGINGLMMLDDELNVNKQVIELMHKIAATNIDWRLRGFVKANLFTEEQAEAMYAAGFRWLLCGFESAHPRILKNIQKMATLEDNTRVIRIAHKYGLKVKALMSFGHPGDSEATLLATRDWLISERPDDFDVTIITVYPGTPYYDDAKLIAPPFYRYEINGDVLYSESIDFARESQYYKGAPGEYKSYVWTDYLTRERMVELRDQVEDEARKALGLSYPTSVAALRFESSMGQSGVGRIPSAILRSTVQAPVVECI